MFQFIVRCKPNLSRNIFKPPLTHLAVFICGFLWQDISRSNVTVPFQWFGFPTYISINILVACRLQYSTCSKRITVIRLFVTLTWLLYLFSASIDSSLVSTDSSPVSTDSSLLAFLLLEPPSTIQMHISLWNMYCFVFWYHFIFFLFEIKNSWLKINMSILRSNIFLKNTVDTFSRLSPSHFNATCCRLWSTGSDRSQSSVVNSMQIEPSEIAAVQISPTEYSTETLFMALKSMGIPLFTSATSHLKFAHEWCVTSSEHEGTPGWTKAKLSSSRRSHYTTYRPVQVQIYIVCVELAIFVGKDSVP